jgi:O-antigen ligase
MRTIAYRLTVAFIFTIPWENAISFGDFGRVSKALGLVTAAIWAVSVVSRGRFRQPGAFQKAFFLFLIWNGLTLYWSIDSAATMRGFLTYTQIFGMLLILWDLFDSEPAIRVALQAYVLGAFVTSASVIVAFLTAPPARFAEHQRFQALSFETDIIALVLAIAAPAAWYLASSPGSQKWPAMRIVNYAYVPLGLFALVLTGTRGASLASIPTVVFVLWSLRHATARKRVIAWGAVGAAVLMVIWLAPREQLTRIGTATTATNLDEGALSGRWGIWTQSKDAFLKRPIIGAGLDAHRAAVAAGLAERSAYKKAEKEAHNTYLSVLVETGMVGFFLFGSMILILLARLRELSGWRAWYWSTQLAVIALGAMSLSLEDNKSVWLFLSLCVASAALAETSRSPFATGRIPITAVHDESMYRRNGQDAVRRPQPARPGRR